MKLERDAIGTTEVLEWKGLTLLNFSQSSCSQKVRILLAEKGLHFRSREIDLKKLEHTTPWYLGINPRGVVPVLVDNGEVHIESNDILAYLEDRYPSAQSWIPKGENEQKTAQDLLELEDSVHDGLRVITMGFLAPAKMMVKSEEELEAYLANGPTDPYRQKQVTWWREFARVGISDEQAHAAVSAFRDAIERLERLLGDREWLVADHPTIADIVWFINIHRLVLAGFPLGNYPSVNRYYARMVQRPAFQREINKGPLTLRLLAPAYRFTRRLRGSTLLPVYNGLFDTDGTTRHKEMA